MPDFRSRLSGTENQHSELPSRVDKALINSKKRKLRHDPLYPTITRMKYRVDSAERASMSQNQPSSGLTVPLVLWGKSPPRNRISCVRSLPDRKTIVTGSFDGELIIWKLLNDGHLGATIMILGHESAITAISPTGVSPNATRFVSASSDGQLSLWESGDGRSVDTVLSTYVHRHIVPYSTKHGILSTCRLYCIGEYAEVVVLDAQDLNVLFTLSSRVEPDWLTAITFFKTYQNIDSVVGISMGGMMKIWRLIDIDKHEASNPVYEEESKSVGLTEVRGVSWASCNRSMVLVITVDSWQVFDLADLNRCFIVDSHEALCGGVIVDVDRVAIAVSNGSVQLFQLPRSSLFGDDVHNRFGKTPADLDGHNEPFVYAALQGYKSASLLWPSHMTFHFDFHTESCTFTVHRADVNGNLAVWTLPKVSEAEVVQRFSKAIVQKASAKTSLAKLWKSLQSPPPSIVHMNDNRSITATLYVSSQGRLVIGRDDGSILIVYACEAISKQLLQTNSTEVSCRRLLGHTSTVTCLLYPHEEHERYDMQKLISGSADFSVIVWNLNTGTRLHRFCVQGGPILRLLIPPENCNARVLHTVCAIAGDNSAALLSLKENKCLLLASRQLFPIIDVRWRPLDDFLLLKCEDDSVYVWQMDTGKLFDREFDTIESDSTNLERVLSGLMSDEVMMACDEQVGIAEGDDGAGASHAVQMFRAFRNKNVDAMRQIASSSGVGGQDDKTSSSTSSVALSEKQLDLPSPMCIQAMNREPDSAHIVFFNVDSLIVGLMSLENDYVASQTLPEHKSLSTILRGGRPSPSAASPSPEPRNVMVAPRIVWQTETNLFLDVARLCLSLLHAWTMDADLDAVCFKKLKLLKPIVPLSFGVVSRQGHMSILLPNARFSQPSPIAVAPCTELKVSNNFDYFANTVRWTLNSSLTTVHLLAIISLANTLMSLRAASTFEMNRSKSIIRRQSQRSSGSDSSDGETQLKQGWSLLAALHCCLLPELVKPKSAYCSPRIELLARKWQDRCMEVRLAAQALLTRELARLGAKGRRRLVDSWSAFLPTLLDPSLSIFGSRTLTASMRSAPTNSSAIPQQQIQQPPPIPPRSSQISLPDTAIPDVTQVEIDSGVQQIRRNQATAIILLGVVGAEFADEMMKMDVSRSTAHSLLELLVAPASPLLPFHSPLRRAAIDLLGRGFTVWQPHLDISKVLLGLLDLAATSEKYSTEATMPVLSPQVDACRTARHALCLIATARPPALITALSKEVALYNSAAQHQTIQTVTSPLLKSRSEVLRIIELLSEKQYSDVADLIIPVGEILVHCLDTSLLKHRTLSEIFPPITKFYMVGYCANTRRIAFGGRNGSVVVHELRAAKSQTIQAHNGSVTSVSFSEDGKYLATYGAEDAKLSFWQTSQTFLGMGQSQLRCVRTQPAPAIFPVLSPSGSPQPFRARIVWINSKSITLMLPNGKEHRFTL
ncbi:unnamed protein product [Anisakis simplex]|uniref:WD_REPEATS_REGION domain-containing protein n=1 Tax=Anisakis simplex TaxID=6269 RepID=A0A0M3IY45_ANISI|nr:unnamed protein product [Anisakis simplex]